jgi:hypothetical protein
MLVIGYWLLDSELIHAAQHSIGANQQVASNSILASMNEQVLLPNFAVFHPPTPIFAANFRTA